MSNYKYYKSKPKRDTIYEKKWLNRRLKRNQNLQTLINNYQNSHLKVPKLFPDIDSAHIKAMAYAILINALILSGIYEHYPHGNGIETYFMNLPNSSTLPINY